MSECPRRCVVLAALALALPALPAADRRGEGDRGFGRPQIDAVRGRVKVLRDAEVVNFGKVAYRGRIDVNPTLAHIRMGRKLPHRNDGVVFFNREGKLPRRPRGYYREFVYPVKGLRLPGPARVVLGKKGEVYFTGDHYNTFTRVH